MLSLRGTTPACGTHDGCAHGGERAPRQTLDASQAHPRSRIYLAALSYSDSQYRWTPSAAELSFLDALDVIIVPIREDQTPELAQLKATFKHASGNGLVYERFCVARFLGVQHVMEARRPRCHRRAGPSQAGLTPVHARPSFRSQVHGLPWALTFDTDLAVHHNAFAAFRYIQDADAMWTFGSWFALYSLERIRSLNAYILDFFQGGPHRVAANFVAFGFSVQKKHNAEYYDRLRNLTADWWPTDGPHAGAAAGVTDMEIQVAWMRASGRETMTCSRREAACRAGGGRVVRGVFSVPVLNVELLHPDNPTGCRMGPEATMAQREGDFVRSFYVDSATGAPMLREEDNMAAAPVVGIHFNGHCKVPAIAPTACVACARSACSAPGHITSSTLNKHKLTPPSPRVTPHPILPLNTSRFRASRTPACRSSATPSLAGRWETTHFWRLLARATAATLDTARASAKPTRLATGLSEGAHATERMPRARCFNALLALSLTLKKIPSLAFRWGGRAGSFECS